MNNRILLTCVIGALVVFLANYFADSSVAGVLLMIFLTLVISMAISADAAKHLHPEMFATLADDAQTIIVENLGTATAPGVRVRIIPEDIRYEIGSLAPDASHRYELPSSIREGKAAVSWEKKDGTRIEKIIRLSEYSDETDPLRPLFPLFSWKEK